jgi:predicted ester cyclase
MKTTSAILPFLLCLIISCQNKQTAVELEEIKAQNEIEEQNKALIEKTIEALNNRNLEIFDECFDPQYNYYCPSISQNPLSLEKIKGFAEILFKAFPDANYGIKEIFAEGDKVIVWNVFSGTHEDELYGIPATGNKIEAGSILIYTIQNGKILEEREESDMLGVMLQMGMELRMKEE